MKTCLCCGRTIEYRKKWSKDRDQIKFCSDRCRKNRVRDEFEGAILELLKLRGNGKTICPSEVLPNYKKQDKIEMEKVKSAARRLVAKGKIEIHQKGHRVDSSTAKGPIRLKLVQGHLI